MRNAIRIDFADRRKGLVTSLVKAGIIQSQKVEQAFLKVPREEFMWPDSREEAYIDSPVGLGTTGQTISAPHMVAIMIEALELEPGMAALEVGAGSGYNAALMAEIIGPTGKVISIDRVPELVPFASANLQRTGFSHIVEVVFGDGTLGYPERSEEERYDRVIVTAAAPRIPKYLRVQLRVGGLILVPVGDRFGQVLIKGVKGVDGRLKETSVCECIFVPLIGADGFS